MPVSTLSLSRFLSLTPLSCPFYYSTPTALIMLSCSLKCVFLLVIIGKSNSKEACAKEKEWFECFFFQHNMNFFRHIQSDTSEFILKFFEYGEQYKLFETIKPEANDSYKHIIRNPEIPLVWDSYKYYWDEYFVQNDTDQKICFYELQTSAYKDLRNVCLMFQRNTLKINIFRYIIKMGKVRVI